MIKQHNTFILLNGYQINPKITQNILYSHGFKSQNTCFSFPNSRTAHHFLFLPKPYIDGPSLISYLHQSFLKIDLRRSWLIFLRFEFVIYGKLPFDYTYMSSWKESMINRLSNLINRNRSAAKISQVLCSSEYSNILTQWCWLVWCLLMGIGTQC